MPPAEEGAFFSLAGGGLLEQNWKHNNAIQAVIITKTNTPITIPAIAPSLSLESSLLLLPPQGTPEEKEAIK